VAGKGSLGVSTLSGKHMLSFVIYCRGGGPKEKKVALIYTAAGSKVDTAHAYLQEVRKESVCFLHKEEIDRTEEKLSTIRGKRGEESSTPEELSVLQSKQFLTKKRG